MEVFRIGELRVDAQAGEVTGPAARVQLDPKVMGVLVMLAERTGQVVSRDDLLARLWPDVVVTDDALSRCLYELRRQLGIASGGEAARALIDTLPKRGYRLNAEITPFVAPPAPRSKHRPGWLLGGAVALAAAAAFFAYRAFGPSAPARVAVLPFLDLSATQDQRFLADGIAEEILDRLYKSKGLEVIARQSSFSFRDKPVDVAEIGRKLDVTHVLEGSIRTSGRRIRVTAQLISTADSAHVWSETYERGLDNLFALQDEIAVAVAGELEAKLSGIEERHATENVDALVQFAQGEYFYYRRAQGDAERAARAYEAAIAIDPGYAQAWAALAGAYGLLADETDPPAPALRDRQGAAAKRAVALDPKLGLAQYRLGQYYVEIGDHERAHRHASEAAKLDPGSPLVISMQVDHAVNRGDYPEAIELMRRAVAADPLALVHRLNLAAVLQTDGHYVAALQEYESVRENIPGEDANIDLDMTRMLVLLGRHAEAAAIAGRMAAGRQKDHATSLLAEVPGMRADSDAALARLAGAPNESALRVEILGSVHLAEAYALRGMNAEAVAALAGKRGALERRPGDSGDDVWYLQTEAMLSPFLKAMHSDPRWRRFMAGHDYPDIARSRADG